MSGDKPVALSSYDDVPANTTAKLFQSPGHAQAELGGGEVVVLERSPRLAAVSEPTPKKETTKSIPEQTKAITELRVLLAKYHANSELPSHKVEVEAVANFIIRMWPELEELVYQAAHESKNPSFKL